MAEIAQPDFTLSGGGTIYLLAPNTDAAREWVEENIGKDNGYQPYYPTVTIEHRYVGPITEGILDDGLTIR